MLSKTHLLTPLTDPVLCPQHEQLWSSAEEEELHGTAPDQEEMRVS